MTEQEKIITEYKAGRLSLDQVKEKIFSLKSESYKHSLSVAQKGLWALQKINPGMTAYNCPICFRIYGTIDENAFRQACHLLMQQYPILKTKIDNKNEKPYQFIDESLVPDIVTEDLSGLKKDQIIALIAQKARLPFDLEQQALLRIYLFHISGNEMFVLLNIHHIIFDGSSGLPLMETWLGFYYALLQKKSPKLKVFTRTYYDFIYDELARIQAQNKQPLLAYWQDQLKDSLTSLKLPTDYPRGTSKNFMGKIVNHKLSPQFNQKIIDFTRNQSIYPTSFFLAVFQLLLSKYSGQKDIIVGMPCDDRKMQEDQSLIGFYLNMIPIRSDFSHQKTFLDLIEGIQKKILDGLANSYPFSTLIKDLKLQKEGEALPVFQIAYEYQNFSGIDELDSLKHNYQDLFKIEFINEVAQEGEYEITLEVISRQNEFEINIKYNPTLYNALTIERMINHYQNLMADVIENPDLFLHEYCMLTEKEQNTILDDYNDTQAEYPDHKCFHEIFELQAVKSPQAIALVYEDQSLTYQELDHKSNLLAAYLQKKGVKPDQYIGICTDRSLEMVIGLLGILKAGAAYVPLDPSYPVERLEYMIIDSRLSLLLTNSQVTDLFSSNIKDNLQIISLIKSWKHIETETEEKKELDRRVQSSDLAYVIYTSGSTGKPKGVMISHQSLNNFLFSMKKEPGFSSQERLLALTTYCFDIAALELFLPLICGATCFICSREKTRDIEKLKQEIKAVKPTVIQATPATWKMLFQSGWYPEHKLKILCGGEAITDALKKEFDQLNGQVWNMFGPTETTIWSTVKRLKKKEPVSIGKPIANTQIYILDAYLQVVPIGVPGELFIAGDGLARGYHDQAQLTQKKFIDHPFIPGKKLYQTGDLARWRADGNIDFIGRRDNQIKIRGFRIELGDIESQLNAHPDIRESVALVLEKEGHKRLIAWYVKKAPHISIFGRDLRKFLKSKLPEYMLPAVFMPISQLPLMPNGKIDRPALANLALTPPAKTGPSSDQSEIEDKVLSIWKEVLDLNQVAPDAGFFEAGGDSVLAVTLVERIKKRLNIDLQVTLLFKYASFKEFSAYIREQYEKSAQKTTHHSNRQDKAPAKQAKQALAPQPVSDDHDSVSIIGISCAIQDAQDHFQFWRHLREGIESIGFFLPDEIARTDLPEEIVNDPHFIPLKSLLQDKFNFDADFFGISPKDASFMDPQFRLLLQHAWLAVEDAGHLPEDMADTSVFISTSQNFSLIKPSGDSGIALSADDYVSWVLSQTGTIPTMISHKLGFKGASYFVHSNCSSSLVGLYSAYQHIKQGKCRTALVGAASIHATDHMGYLHQPGLNFSSDGHIKAFDKNADGMNGGEGVAVVVLKDTQQAIADGDHIYGILKGIDLNNDGKDKAGYYAPSIKGQSEVIRSVLKESKINPQSISYVEAHGTGTKLGDPIELTALSEVYQEYTEQKQFCGIGSVKSNIGHLDVVAGLAGCIKIILSLYYNQLPPTINYQEPNPEFDFNHSPFYVVRQLKDGKKDCQPLRAALSSFGLGGTNTHAVFEQYSSFKNQKIEENGPYLIPLSAKNKDRLDAYLLKMLDFLQSAAAMSQVNISDLAYTLQVGRQMMQYRLALIVNSKDELIQKLKELTHKNQNPENCYLGSGKNELTWLLENAEELDQLTHKWLKNRDLDKLAALWVKGLPIKWKALYQEHNPIEPDAVKRIPVPGYPFAKEYYPLFQEKSFKTGQPSKISAVNYLHPLLHVNTSILEQQQFTCRLSGQEFFLRDHVIGNVKILPGVAYLEMARAALQNSGLHPVTALSEVTWISPIEVKDQVREIEIALLPDANSCRFEVCSFSHSQKTLHCQGLIIAGLDSQQAVVHKNVEEIMQRCPKRISGQKIYAILQVEGSYYGPSFQGIEHLQKNDHEILARIRLPDMMREKADSFYLHPSIMDMAFQLTDSLLLQPDAEGGHLPFFVQNVHIYDKTPASGYIHVYFSDSKSLENGISRYDIDIMDQKGKVCVSFQEFMARPIVESRAQSDLVYLSEKWVEKNIRFQEEFPVKTHIFHSRFSGQLTETINRQPHFEKVILLPGLNPKHKSQTAYENFWFVFQYLQSLIASQPQENHQLLLLIARDEYFHFYAPLLGLIKTAVQENSKISGKVICFNQPDKLQPKHLLQILQEESQDSSLDIEICYDGQNRRKVKQLYQVKMDQDPAHQQPLKAGGVYWITGGAGKLALILADHFSKICSCSLILSGRSSLSEEKQKQIKAIEKKGSTIEHLQCDFGNDKEVESVYQKIKAKYGRISGIIHCAGVIKDSLIINKTEEEINQVFLPKINGLCALDELTVQDDLDFFILFSSISGILGNIGQADYAGANAFLDAFAHFRNTLLDEGKRQGKTLSLDWPYWKEGGMRIEQSNEKNMLKSEGLIPLQTGTGIRALFEALSSNQTQLLVMEGEQKKIKEIYLTEAKVESKHKPAVVMRDSLSASHKKALINQIRGQLMPIISDILNLDQNKINWDKEFGEYGFDSISLTTFGNQLNKKFKLQSEGYKAIVPTLFFEYPSLTRLSDYLGEHYADLFFKKTDLATENSKVISTDLPVNPTSVPQARFIPRQAQKSAHQSLTQIKEDIAIIGMSGSFPQAATIDEFWKNLAEEKNCITEIPKDRWDWQEYYGDPNLEENKTNIKWGGFINGVADFDPLFFGISPKEARQMDPDHRLLMTHIWKAIEDAGYAPDHFSGTSTGIFVGIGHSGYGDRLSKSQTRIDGKSALGGIPSIGPNRMSHFLNLHGPSEPIETACSSSLVAIHRAINAINAGDCDLCIVGGVHTILTPDAHIGFSKAGMLSPDGLCKTFSSQANGYVRGEGVGILVLKKLSTAQKDNDSIYGVIKGSFENHGGKANTLTSPNIKAQKQVIKNAIKRAGIDPQSVTYIEAHGTGTHLGDPVEIEGLKIAFQELFSGQDSSKKAAAFCGLGSVKTNIGHLELAAGIAGVIKVLLQFKHKKLVKSLHCSQINPYIQLEESPFYIVRQTQEWKRQINHQGVEIPLRAGISSFGFGGVNAHVVLEEYVEPSPTEIEIKIQSPTPLLMLFSARNESSLKNIVSQFVDLLQQKQWQEKDLIDMAYTLQVGRNAMPERLGVIVNTLDELKEKLQDYLTAKNSQSGFKYGRVKLNPDEISLFTTDEDLVDTISLWFKKKKYANLLDLWLKGITIDWNRLYTDQSPKRIHLPTYSFKKERLWIDTEQSSKQLSPLLPAKAGYLHPLVQQNVSIIGRQQFASVFQGDEFFLKDHHIDGHCLLPGVAYLEMAKTAAENSGINNISQFKDVVWIQPIAVADHPCDLQINLHVKGSQIHYQINSTHLQNSLTHGQGIMLTEEDRGKRRPKKDIKLILERCSLAFSGAEFYERLKERGTKYGVGFQAIEKLYKNDQEAFASLMLPHIKEIKAESFFLHPTIMDAAFQIIDSLILQPEIETSNLPFFVKQVKIYKRTPARGYVHVYFSDSQKTRPSFTSYDIDILDQKGDVCLSYRGFISKPIQTTALIPDLIYFKEKLVEKEAVSEKTGALNQEQWLLLSDEIRLSDAVKQDCQITDTRSFHCQHIINSSQRIKSVFMQTFEVIQQLIKAKKKSNLIILINQQAHDLTYATLSGLIKTLILEQPKIKAKIISISHLPQWSEKQLATVIRNEVNDLSHDLEVYYDQESRRQVKQFEEIKVHHNRAEQSWPPDKGVFWITGAMGKLGLIFANYLIRMKARAIILSGRSLIDDKKMHSLTQAAQDVTKVEYIQADMASYADVANIVSLIKQKYRSLTGILHCAGHINDSLLVNKNQEEIEKVFAAKVDGLLNMDRAINQMALDYLILFSSVSAVFGNIGQADYAGANAFMDHYAAYRNQLQQQGEIKGKTISINWPLWEEGAMQIAQTSKVLAAQSQGWIPLRTESGLKAFEQILKHVPGQIMLFEGDARQIRRKLLKNEDHLVKQKEKQMITGRDAPDFQPGQLIDHVKNSLTSIIADMTQINKHEINPATELQNYGFDSIGFTELSNQLNLYFNIQNQQQETIIPTLFFEYSTIDTLAGYISQKYQAILQEKYLPGVKTSSKKKISFSQADHQYQSLIREIQTQQNLENHEQAIDEEIAIVGMSGCFPKARNVQQFWENLKNGENCISEIPAGRWDWRKYYGDPAEEGHHTNIKWGGFIDGIRYFDPTFFNISPREAVQMDPHHRLLMTHIYWAIEDAGYAPASLSGTQTGIFAGIATSEYSDLMTGSAINIDGKSALGGIPSIGPSRMSHFLNLHGPSEPIETACSSSLVAIHRAVLAIKNKDCEMALVGGVNTILTPDAHIGFSKAGMLSPDGLCKTFSNQANGYVRGEGVGALFLKRLKHAVADGDTIYAVIKASVENHGGRANSITAPNANAQRDLIIEAYLRARIEPDTIGYIEAHGTGTSLGDPIEIDSLKKAFQQLYAKKGIKTIKKQSCGLGSVKTNIGHLEIAAGMASVIKVLQQLKHSTLVPSLHCSQINPYIKIEDTPFYIVRETREWKPALNEKGMPVPRRAGISSFGFGGVNAHIVVEEYRPQQEAPMPVIKTLENPVPILLSAKSQSQVREIAQNLIERIKHNDYKESDLTRIAYTLQVGRESMEERLALIVSSIQELRDKLTDYLKDKKDISPLFTGKIKKYQKIPASPKKEQDLTQKISAYFEDKDYEKLLQLWCKGITIQWERLYQGNKPKRISLPTYPFAKEQYWIAQNDSHSLALKREKSGKIHPLVHENTSTLQEQRFTSIFSGQEPFFNDYQGKGNKELPEAAFIEMASIALQKAAAINQQPIHLFDLIWENAFVVHKEDKALHLALIPEKSDEIAFEFFGQKTTGHSQEIIYSQGKAKIVNPLQTIKPIHIESIKQTCDQQVMTEQEIYAAFQKTGIAYGNTDQPIKKLYFSNDLVLACLQVSDPVKAGLQDYCSYTGILNSLFQGLLYLRYNKGMPITAGPDSVKAIDRIEIIDQIPERVWIIFYIRDNEQERGTIAGADICDNKGKVIVRLRGIKYHSREIESPGPVTQSLAIDQEEIPKRIQLFEGNKKYTIHSLKEDDLHQKDFKGKIFLDVHKKTFNSPIVSSKPKISLTRNNKNF